MQLIFDPGHPKYKRSLLISAYLRWIFIIPFTILIFIEGSHTVSPAFVYIVWALLALYLAVIAFFLKSIYEEGKKHLFIILFIDSLFLTGFTYMLGGINSDIYMVFLFLIGYAALSANFTDTVKLAVFCAIAYTMAVTVSFQGSLDEFPILGLAMRDILFICEAFGISVIKLRERKYENLNKLDFKLARTDKLTGLANRHYFEQKLVEEKKYSDTSGRPLNIMMFDLDDFKLFNDTYGHPRGDKLLYLFSDIIRQNTRKTDIPVRYGGEEFLMIVRDLDIGMAKAIGERIRSQLEKQRIYIGDDPDKRKVTVSCGIAQYPLDSRDIKQVIEFADQALYAAKASGKNAVYNYPDTVLQKQH